MLINLKDEIESKVKIEQNKKIKSRILKILGIG